MLHVLPPLMAVLTTAPVVAIVRRFTRSQAAAARAEYSTPLAACDRHRAELDDELRDLG